MNRIEQLVGVWKTAENDHISIREFGLVRLIFTDDGELLYCIDDEKKTSIISLMYIVTEDDYIITTQLQTGEKEKTKFEFDDECLTLYYDNIKTRFIRDLDA